MIRNEAEYGQAVARLNEEHARLDDHRKRLAETGLSADEIKRVIDPIVSFHLQLREEVESYERLKRGEFPELENFNGIGNLLISLRIAGGISQRELAKRLGVHESQVSRDERNEYFGITVDRATKLLNALHTKVSTTVEAPPNSARNIGEFKLKLKKTKGRGNLSPPHSPTTRPRRSSTATFTSVRQAKPNDS